ncbi:hypothetical protein AAU57_06945 [Nonlabens sp. YIK11]|uniref:putative signal transducing protein n=1 Tax=Nonlabens sp. YIK11 TaxID=1453349 RepID=UPI0006DC03B7|nr:DUF2007 domain-containing protein [Nonlabens sp. YIK11]KQC33081.1 hypothetical protein AAU57_06945 [Nonlabens sp. YIK11]
MKNHIKIFTSDSITVRRMADVLENNNISVIIKDETESGRLAGFGVPDNSVELFVSQEDAQKAQELIASVS